jgi:hypothetical protein
MGSCVSLESDASAMMAAGSEVLSTPEVNEVKYLSDA